MNPIDSIVSALRNLPEDVDMIEHNPDEGPSYFCCGRDVSFHTHPSRWPPGSIEGRVHAPGCWYAAAVSALSNYDQEKEN